MRTVVHLSDLHFGRVDAAVLAPLRSAIEKLKPDVVVVSGDLTQRARSAQFRAARDFLDTLPTPQIVVPGNHDIPFYDVVRRFFAPLVRFRRYISDDPMPEFRDDEVAIIGVNTARSLTFKGGRINSDQVKAVAQRFEGLPERITRIVVTHHPFDVPKDGDQDDVLGRAPMAMAEFARAEVDVFLSGHLHHSNISTTAHRYHIGGFAALVVQAGTATSTRERGELNAFNVLRIGERDLQVQTWRWEPAPALFAQEAETSFRYVRGEGWQGS
ncbi:metallophosphoesterase family protein [Thermomonas sp.]